MLEPDFKSDPIKANSIGTASGPSAFNAVLPTALAPFIIGFLNLYAAAAVPAPANFSPAVSSIGAPSAAAAADIPPIVNPVPKASGLSLAGILD